MRLVFTILTATVLLFSCEKQRDQVEKFIFDSKQIASRQIHTYEFNDEGQITVDNSVTYYYMAGIPFDTIVSKDIYEYTSKGKVKSIVNLTDSTKRLMTYNEVDSLMGDFRINQMGDTTLLFINEYQNGKLTSTINRMLNRRLPKNIEDIKLDYFDSYDTILFVSEIFYNGDQIEKSISRDAKGNITGEIQSVYEDGKHVKDISYSFIGSSKYVSETTNYIYENGRESGFTTTNAQGDTTTYLRTEFQDEMRIVITYFGQADSKDIQYYDKQNRLIGNIVLMGGVKYGYSYTYDDRGNRTEEINYKEKK